MSIDLDLVQALFSPFLSFLFFFTCTAWRIVNSFSYNDTPFFLIYTFTPTFSSCLLPREISLIRNG
jgi:hypothetical protein